MKKLAYIVSTGAFLFLGYCAIVWFYAFVHPTPWGVERYLALRGMKGVAVMHDWGLQSHHFAKPSKLIGKFSQFTTINVSCEEFDVADITGCTQLGILHVNFPGVMKNFCLLKHMDVFHVAGTVDEPIMDKEMLAIMKDRNWGIRLNATSNTISQVCLCPGSDIYAEVNISADAFRCASCDDIDRLRKQKFCDINGYREDCFWQMHDAGIFPCGVGYYDISGGKMPEKSNWARTVAEIHRRRSSSSGPECGDVIVEQPSTTLRQKGEE